MPTSENTEVVVTRLRPDTLDDLDEIRDELDLTRAAYVRRAVIEKIERDRKEMQREHT